jgi:hypothetical protein
LISQPKRNKQIKDMNPNPAQPARKTSILKFIVGAIIIGGVRYAFDANERAHRPKLPSTFPSYSASATGHDRGLSTAYPPLKAPRYGGMMYKQSTPPATAASVPVPVPAPQPVEAVVHSSANFVLYGSPELVADAVKVVKQLRPLHVAAGIVSVKPDDKAHAYDYYYVALCGENAEIDQMWKGLNSAVKSAHAGGKTQLGVSDLLTYADPMPLPRMFVKITGEPSDPGGQVVWFLPSNGDASSPEGRSVAELCAAREPVDKEHNDAGTATASR